MIGAEGTIGKQGLFERARQHYVLGGLTTCRDRFETCPYGRRDGVAIVLSQIGALPGPAAGAVTGPMLY